MCDFLNLLLRVANSGTRRPKLEEPTEHSIVAPMLKRFSHVTRPEVDRELRALLWEGRTTSRDPESGRMMRTTGAIHFLIFRLYS